MSAALIRQKVETAFRDYETAGVPSSGDHEPVKSEIRYALGELLETTLGAIGSGIERFATKAELDAAVAFDDGQLAYVYDNNGDPADALNGVYQWDDGGAQWVIADWYLAAVDAAIDALDAKVDAIDALAVDAQQRTIDAGVPAAADLADYAETGFLMVNVSNPATRRNIVRTADKITLTALYSSLTAGFIFPDLDGDQPRGGRIYSAEVKLTASGGGIQAIGVGPVAEARAATARGDATDTTLMEVEAAATNDAKFFALRTANGIQGFVQETGSVVQNGADGQIAATSTNDYLPTWAVGDTIRVVLFVPNDDSPRRIDWYKKAAGLSGFAHQAWATVNAANWPAESDPWVGIYTTATYTAEFANFETVAAQPADPSVRYMDASAAITGAGGRTDPVTNLRELFQSVRDENDHLYATIGDNGGEPYRVYRSTGIVVPHARFRELTLLGDTGRMPEIRGSHVPGAWAAVSGDVWRTQNFWNGVASVTNGAVVSYAPDEIGFDWYGVNRRCLRHAGANASVATLQGATEPSYSLNNGDGFMYVVLPDGQDPNVSGELELVQCVAPLVLDAPAGNDLLWRPRVTIRGLQLYGGVISGLRAYARDVLLERVFTGAAVADALEFFECSGQTYSCRSWGAQNDCLKSNPIAGGPLFDQSERPVLTHFDMDCRAAGFDGNGDTVSLHHGGGKMIFHGGRFWGASKHNMSQIDDFEAYGVDCRGGAGGGIIIAPSAGETVDFAIVGGLIRDAGTAGNASTGGILVTPAAGAGQITGRIDGVAITAPDVATPRGLYVTNASGDPAMIELDLLGLRIDDTIVEPVVGLALATVSQPTFV